MFLTLLVDCHFQRGSSRVSCFVKLKTKNDKTPTICQQLIKQRRGKERKFYSASSCLRRKHQEKTQYMCLGNSQGNKLAFGGNDNYFFSAESSPKDACPRRRVARMERINSFRVICISDPPSVTHFILICKRNK